jgi:hypothetical protein
MARRDWPYSFVIGRNHFGTNNTASECGNPWDPMCVGNHVEPGVGPGDALIV